MSDWTNHKVTVQTRSWEQVEQDLLEIFDQIAFYKDGVKVFRKLTLAQELEKRGYNTDEIHQLSLCRGGESCWCDRMPFPVRTTEGTSTS